MEILVFLVFFIVGLLALIGALLHSVATAAFVAGILFAPASALICRANARKMDVDVRRYTIAGAVYSLFLLFPAVYFIIRINGKSVPAIIVTIAYLILFGGWIFATGIHALSFSEVRPSFASPTSLVENAWVIIILTVSAITFVYSVIRLAMRTLFWDQWRRFPAETDDSDFIEPAFIIPFACSFLIMVLHNGMRLITIIADLT